MPIGKIGGSNNSIPDLNELDSNPQSVAGATGQSSKLGEIGHRAIQFINNLPANLRSVVDSFSHAIENKFSGSAKDNLKALFQRNPKQIDTPIELQSFKSSIDDTYAQIGSYGHENQTYGSLDETKFTKTGKASGNYAQADEPIYGSLSDVKTGNDDYVEAAPEEDEYVTAAPQGDYVNLKDTGVEAIYASLSEIATEATYVNLAEISSGGFEGFTPDTTQPADTEFHARVDSNSSPALKQALGFVKHVLDHHGAAGGKALAEAGIFRNKKVIGQVTPQLLNDFEKKLKEVKAAYAAKVAEGFDISASQVKYEKFNSDNADSPIHHQLSKPIFTSSPKLADKVKWEFDQVLARGASGVSVIDIAESIARQVVAEKLKESFDAGRSDSPLHEILASSSLANAPTAKLENIKAAYDSALSEAGINFAYDGALDKPFDPEAFRSAAIDAAKATIAKYTI